MEGSKKKDGSKKDKKDKKKGRKSSYRKLPKEEGKVRYNKALYYSLVLDHDSRFILARLKTIHSYFYYHFYYGFGQIPLEALPTTPKELRAYRKLKALVTRALTDITHQITEEQHITYDQYSRLFDLLSLVMDLQLVKILPTIIEILAFDREDHLVEIVYYCFHFALTNLIPRIGEYYETRQRKGGSKEGVIELQSFYGTKTTVIANPSEKVMNELLCFETFLAAEEFLVGIVIQTLAIHLKKREDDLLGVQRYLEGIFSLIISIIDCFPEKRLAEGQEEGSKRRRSEKRSKEKLAVHKTMPQEEGKAKYPKEWYYSQVLGKGREEILAKLETIHYYFYYHYYYNHKKVPLEALPKNQKELKAYRKLKDIINQELEKIIEEKAIAQEKKGLFYTLLELVRDLQMVKALPKILEILAFEKRAEFHDTIYLCYRYLLRNYQKRINEHYNHLREGASDSTGIEVKTFTLQGTNILETEKPEKIPLKEVLCFESYYEAEEFLVEIADKTLAIHLKKEKEGVPGIRKYLRAIFRRISNIIDCFPESLGNLLETLELLEKGKPQRKKAD